MEPPATAAPKRTSGHLADACVTVVAALAGAAMAASGVWQLGWPHAFSAWAGFPPDGHFLHDSGAFSIGLGLALLLTTVCSDAATTVLAAFLVANTVHFAYHVADRDLGGRTWTIWLLGAGSLLTAAALTLRLRRITAVRGIRGTTPGER
ncbi:MULTISPECIES: hypothetical protein [Streptomycetaceae]|uniref:Pyridoxamine 5'-phosphate oxidase-related, FMN-binding protein n=1 Tax=Streptantibioticus cattleyicolor (strain ATCC 35852 / DSM 46488 / JCM 4925 / NBRC 14057 / NRRL 8057) TaxID=1003195 RepID=F8JZT3_STREN|nr:MULTISPECIES: hypothetical protein [Streptomycetaceae]AEW93516.1 pyridoxamine 5'-phosphate oxidase-related, FMN-binding protein [Streptantibioticus cattleyicolor NRRL 8057 = DSM 46488]MYS58225.1 pyridoxamine 5'-phosphate oxidase [Streptomyces sp. SID5468]CCB73867.1 conserved membrane protein of unknown function [Streptantibioticus cattleyicolor NRRL 8057 = DSM 46488]